MSAPWLYGDITREESEGQFVADGHSGRDNNFGTRNVCLLCAGVVIFGV